MSYTNEVAIKVARHLVPEFQEQLKLAGLAEFNESQEPDTFYASAIRWDAYDPDYAAAKFLPWLIDQSYEDYGMVRVGDGYTDMEWDGAYADYGLAIDRTVVMSPPVNGEQLEHLRTHGHFCPFCRSSEIRGEEVVIDDDQARQEMSCDTCSRAWENTYRLSGFAPLEAAMGHTEDPSMVRVDFFKPSGKWYCTEAVKWTGAWKGELAEGGEMIHDAFARSLRDHLGGRLSDMDAVCLEPYHEFSHPILIKNGGWLHVAKEGNNG